MDPVDYGWVEKCDFYRVQINNNIKKKTLMTGIFHRLYNFYKMSFEYIKMYSTPMLELLKKKNK